MKLNMQHIAYVDWTDVIRVSLTVVAVSDSNALGHERYAAKSFN